MLILNYLSFVVSGFFWAIKTRIKADFVFIFEVSPMTQALPGIWYAKKTKIPCFLYVQDLWPENVEIITGIKSKIALGMIGRLVDYIYANCTKIFTTSISFIKSIEERGVPAGKLEYWPQYAEDYYVPVSKTVLPEIPSDDIFNIIFTGNIGNAQGLDILPKVALLLKERQPTREIRFNVVGDGRFKDALIETVKTQGVQEMFNFIPKQPAIRIPEFLAACDAAFLCLINSPLFAMTIPAKLQSYMACGIPIIASAEGEAVNIINEADAGLCSHAGDEKGLADIIVKLSAAPKEKLNQYGENARNYYMEHFNKDELMDRMDMCFSNMEQGGKYVQR
jgi:glycosyltransferase involved in cell wall biosynthesis